MATGLQEADGFAVSKPQSWHKCSQPNTVLRVAEDTLVVFSTFPDLETARRIGQVLVEEKLAACVNLIPQIESIYRWEDKLESSSEVLGLIKTTTWTYDQLEARIRCLHPYEVPEVIALRVQSGLPAYLNWIEQTMQ